MDSEALFKPSRRVLVDKNQEKKPLGIDPALVYAPLTYALTSKILPHNFILRTGPAGQNALDLREGELELALISSLAYGQKKETWRIVPDLCLASGGIGHAYLFFKKGLKDIRTVAVDQNASSEEVLMQILMREKYGQKPEYISMPADLGSMLDRAEAALIIGDKALGYLEENSNRLDLSEEWVDLTGLPFVYAFWAGREFTVTTEEVKKIQNSYEIGKRNLEPISRDFAESRQSSWVFYHDYLTKEMTYVFSEREQEGLREFYQFAFFYGLTEYIPDLHFYPV